MIQIIKCARAQVLGICMFLFGGEQGFGKEGRTSSGGGILCSRGSLNETSGLHRKNRSTVSGATQGLLHI